MTDGNDIFKNAFYSRYKVGCVTILFSSCRRAAFHSQVLPRTSCSHRRSTAMLPVPPHWKPASAASAPGTQRRRPAAANRPWKPAARAPTRGQQPSAEPTSWHQNPAVIPTQTRQTSTTSALMLKLFGLRNLCVPGEKKPSKSGLVGNVVDSVSALPDCSRWWRDQCSHPRSSFDFKWDRFEKWTKFGIYHSFLSNIAFLASLLACFIAHANSISEFADFSWLRFNLGLNFLTIQVHAFKSWRARALDDINVWN